MDKLGIFGGSFNPIHNGHIGLVSAAMKLYNLNKVLLMPCRMPPHKLAPELALPQHRLEMCRLSCEGIDNLEVNDLEFHMPEPSYTFDTVTELKKLYPNSQMYLIIGADMLLTFEKWFKWHELGSMVTILAGGRIEGQDELLINKARKLCKEGIKVDIFHYNVTELSSTEIREYIKQGRDISEFVPNKVKEYIDKNGLYSNPEEAD